MRPLIFLVLSSLLILLSYLVFRVNVRRGYERRGGLSLLSTLLECLIFFLHGNCSYAFLPARWPALPSLPESKVHSAFGLSILVIGIAIALGSMINLGVSQTLGQQTDTLYRSGFYQYTRNPQIVAYGLAVIGAASLWPSVYGLGWILIYGAVAHMMILTEEEHLGRIFGSEYEHYCREVPRYLPWPR